MEYQVVKKIHINKDKCRKIGEFYYNESEDGLYFESPWPFPVQLYIREGLSSCQVTPGFLRLPFILKGWINLDILLREIDVLTLALQGKILMHGSCVDNKLIVGFPNAGKTYQTYKEVAQGGSLISEEYTVLSISKSGKNVHAEPYKPIMRTCFSRRTIEDCGIDISFGESVKLWLSEIRAMLMPFMFEGAIWKEIPASGKTSKIKRIEYGSTDDQVTHWKGFAILCENEFPFMSSEFLQAYAFASGLDLLGIQEKQRKLIKEIVERVYPDHRK